MLFQASSCVRVLALATPHRLPSETLLTMFLALVGF